MELISAVKNENEELVKNLLERDDIDVNVESADQVSATPLMMASFLNNSNIVRMLLNKKNINVNIKNPFDGTTALMAAVNGGAENAIKLLLQRRDLDINAQDKFGDTALIRAVEKRKPAVVNLLMQRSDINVHIANIAGTTAPEFAMGAGMLDSFQTMLKGKERVQSDNTPMMSERKSVKANGKKKKEFTETNQKGDVVLREYTTNDVYDKGDGPAYIKYDNKGNIIKQMFYKAGELHNTNGPAVIDFSGKVKKEEYWLNGVKVLKDEYDLHKPIQSKYFIDVPKEKIKEKCGDGVDYLSTEPFVMFDNVFVFKQNNGTFRCFSSDELKYIIDNYDNKTKTMAILRGTPAYEFGGDEVIAEISRILREINKRQDINKKYGRKLNPYSLLS